MSSDRARAGARPSFTAAYAAFLASLALPGAGQILTGVAARGVVLFLLASSWIVVLAAGVLRLPTAAGAGPVDAAVAAIAAGLWSFAAYDAWLRARENALGMAVLLPRTPRVAAAADLLWGGMGHLYLGRGAGFVVAAVTGALLLALGRRVASAPGAAWRPATMLLLAALGLWNMVWAWRSWSWAAARWHGTRAWAERRAALEEAPFSSAQNPSPSLPLATLVAAGIAVLGLGLVQRSLRELATPADMAVPPATTGRVEAGVFVDEAHGLSLDLPDEVWTFAAGPAPTLLAGRRDRDGATLTLAVAERPLFEAGDVVPRGALERHAARQEAELHRALPGFEPVERRAGSFAGADGVRLLFRAAPAGRPALVGQHYRMAGMRLVVLTLSAPPATPPDALGRQLDFLVAGLQISE